MWDVWTLVAGWMSDSVGGPPHPHSAVICGTGQHAGDVGVPVHTVHSPRMTLQLGDGDLSLHVPDVHFVVCNRSWLL